MEQLQGLTTGLHPLTQGVSGNQAPLFPSWSLTDQDRMDSPVLRTRMGLGPHRALSLESLPASPFHRQGNGSPEMVSGETPLTQVEETLQA